LIAYDELVFFDEAAMSPSRDLQAITIGSLDWHSLSSVHKWKVVARTVLKVRFIRMTMTWCLRICGPVPIPHLDVASHDLKFC
jgi:hypothetical protein